MATYINCWDTLLLLCPVVISTTTAYVRIGYARIRYLKLLMLEIRYCMQGQLMKYPINFFAVCKLEPYFTIIWNRCCWFNHTWIMKWSIRDSQTHTQKNTNIYIKINAFHIHIYIINNSSFPMIFILRLCLLKYRFEKFVLRHNSYSTCFFIRS